MIQRSSLPIHRGITIIELMIGIGIIGVIASVVIVAISPRIQFTAARDAWRRSMVREIHSAIVLYTDWNHGTPPAGILSGKCQKRPICRQGMGGQANCVDLDEIIDAKFIVDWPVDVAEGSGALTGFTVYTDPNAFFTTVEASYLGVSGYAVDEGRQSTTTFITDCPCRGMGDTNPACGCQEDATYPIGPDGGIYALGHNGFLYTINELGLSDKVSIFDMNSDIFVDSLSVGAKPVHMVIVGGNLYVLNQDDNSITVIDTASKQVTGTYSLTGGNTPKYMTVVGTKIYVSSYANNKVLVYDTSDNSIEDSITGLSNAGASILVGTKLYVWTPTANAIKVIDTADDNDVIASIGGLQAGGGFVANGQYLYALSNGTFVYKINTADNSIIATYTDLGGGGGINPRYGVVVGSSLYVMNYSGNSVSIIDTTTNVPTTTTIPLSGAPVYATPSADNAKLYILRNTAGMVSVLRLSDNTFIKEYDFNQDPLMSVLSGRRLFVVFFTGLNGLDVIDTEAEEICR